MMNITEQTLKQEVPVSKGPDVAIPTTNKQHTPFPLSWTEVGLETRELLAYSAVVIFWFYEFFKHTIRVHLTGCSSQQRAISERCLNLHFTPQWRRIQPFHW